MAAMQDPQTLSDEIVVFELSGRQYGLRSSAVREVLRAFSAVPLPNAPALVEGVLNVRGEIMALLNVHKRFGLAERPLSLSDHFIIAWEGVRWVALRVDRVLNLIRVPISKRVDADQFLTSAELVSGVAITKEGLILIHDLGRFLSSADQEQLTQALAVQPGVPSR